MTYLKHYRYRIRYRWHVLFHRWVPKHDPMNHRFLTGRKRAN